MKVAIVGAKISVADFNHAIDDSHAYIQKFNTKYEQITIHQFFDTVTSGNELCVNSLVELYASQEEIELHKVDNDKDLVNNTDFLIAIVDHTNNGKIGAKIGSLIVKFYRAGKIAYIHQLS